MRQYYNLIMAFIQVYLITTYCGSIKALYYQHWGEYMQIKTLLEEAITVKKAMISSTEVLDSISNASKIFNSAVKDNKLIMACGNGGSTCDAMHFVEELVARYKRERPGIRAIHLMDPSILTCWSNDYDFHSVFSRQVETHAQQGDLLFGFSTSGNSKNVIAAFETAKNCGVTTVGLLGKNGGKLKELSDIPIIIPSEQTERIQEAHITIVHILCEMMELANIK